MDMWEPYFKATLKHVPGAVGKIVHDRFHVMKHVGEAVGLVRKQEHREHTSQDDHRLKGTKYLRLYREVNLPDKHRPALEALKAANLKVAKAWAMEESLDDIWKCLITGWTRRFVKRWLAWVNKSGLAPMRKGGADPEIYGEHPDLLPSSDHQRRGRRAEQQNHGHQEEGLRPRQPSTSSAGA